MRIGTICGLLLLASCPGCPQEEKCGQVMATRCGGQNGNTAQYCASNGNWLETTNCDLVTPGKWQCGDRPNVEGKTCVKVGD